MQDNYGRTAVSIICPVFNARDTIDRCVDSILAQSFSNWELILVDDGSTDGSGSLCDGFSAKDSRIKVLHYNNEGVSSARQHGMDTASGEYFTHIDPDDWISTDWVGGMYDTALTKDADIVICDFMMVFRNGSRLSRQCHPCYSQRHIAMAVSGAKMSHSICNKLVRRSVFDKYGLSFPEGLQASEDALVCHSLFIKGVKCAFCEGVYYYYDRFSNDNSLTRVRLERILEAVQESVTMLEKVEGDRVIRDRAIRTLKSVAKMKAFYFLPYEDFRDVYREYNTGYVLRNLYKFTKVEGYVALALVIRDNNKAYSLFMKLKRLIGRT